MNVDNTMINFTNWLPILTIIGIMFIIIWRWLPDNIKFREPEVEKK
jgi:hypothetical protein